MDYACGTEIPPLSGVVRYRGDVASIAFTPVFLASSGRCCPPPDGRRAVAPTRMKTITLIQRLRTGFGTVCLVAILCGAAVAWQAWRSVDRQFAAERIRGQAATMAERMRFATLQMGEALLGVLLDPQSQAERSRKLKADEELRRTKASCGCCCETSRMRCAPRWRP